jgi:hypothetical protein
VSTDTLLFAGASAEAKDRARALVASFERLNLGVVIHDMQPGVVR